MILPSRQTWFISATLAVVVLAAATWIIGRSGGCDDNRPALDDRVGEQGKALGEAKEDVAASGGAKDVASEASRRVAFRRDSEAQLVQLAAEIERRAAMGDLPAERVESLRRDHGHLREQRQRVIDSTDAAFDDNLLQFETHVNTIREQLGRVDDGKTP
jgi:hypothetical protein